MISFSVPGFSQHFPSTGHSRSVVERVRPLLTGELSEKGLNYGSPVFIRIFKEEKELELWVGKNNQFELFKTYDICTYGSTQKGPKTKEGDRKAPEGFYFIAPDQLYPYSNFHLAFNIGYPNRYDRLHGRTGSAIMVHGACSSTGCFAMTDPVIEEIYTLVEAALKNGQGFIRIHIFPFRMTEENMLKHSGSEWYSFWENLAQGYRTFESNGNRPPNVSVVDGRYVVGR